MKPSVGRIVLYTLTAGDADAINLRRSDHDSYRARHAAALRPRQPGEPGATGLQAHVGNEVAAGDEFPAMVVRTWATETQAANLQVFLDGNDTYWAQSRPSGDGPGEWHFAHWPRIEREPGDRPHADSSPSSFRPGF